MYVPQENAHADTGPAHVRVCIVRPPVRVRGGTTPTRSGRWTARVRTWVVPIGAHVRVHFFLCTLLQSSQYILTICSVPYFYCLLKHIAYSVKQTKS